VSEPGTLEQEAALDEVGRGGFQFGLLLDSKLEFTRTLQAVNV